MRHASGGIVRLDEIVGKTAGHEIDHKRRARLLCELERSVEPSSCFARLSAPRVNSGDRVEALNHANPIADRVLNH